MGASRWVAVVDNDIVQHSAHWWNRDRAAFKQTNKPTGWLHHYHQPNCVQKRYNDEWTMATAQMTRRSVIPAVVWAGHHPWRDYDKTKSLRSSSIQATDNRCVDYHVVNTNQVPPAKDLTPCSLSHRIRASSHTWMRMKAGQWDTSRWL